MSSEDAYARILELFDSQGFRGNWGQSPYAFYMKHFQQLYFKAGRREGCCSITGTYSYLVACRASLKGKIKGKLCSSIINATALDKVERNSLPLPGKQTGWTMFEVASSQHTQGYTDNPPHHTEGNPSHCTQRRSAPPTTVLLLLTTYSSQAASHSWHFIILSTLLCFYRQAPLFSLLHSNWTLHQIP